MNPTKPGPVVNSETPPASPRDTLSITDNRNGRQYEVPIKHDTIRALDLRQIKIRNEDFGMMGYDPAFTNTASCSSRITFIDGDKGILRYRGYSIEELAEKSTYIETAYLILYGELPTKSQLADWSYNVTHHTFIHESIKKFLDGFHYDAHPMGMLISTVAALSTFYPDAKDIFNPESRRKQTYRLIGKMPTLAAFSYRHSLGMPYAYPDNDLSYPGNFLNMLFRTTELKYRPNPTPWTSCLFCTRTTSRIALPPPCAVWEVPTWTPIPPPPPPPPRCMARFMAARTKPCCACSWKSARSKTCPPTSTASRPAKSS